MERLVALVQDHIPPPCPRPDSLASVPSLLLSDLSCAKASLSLAVGLAIVLLAGVIKLPQILAVLSARSGDGLSLATLLIETFGYSYNLAAHYRLAYPISTYGDFAVLAVQNCVIIALVHRFAGTASSGAAVVVAAVALLALMCSPLFPLAALKFLTLLNVPVTIAARLPQITKSYANKSTGSLSAITCVGLFLGASARVFTTLQSVDNVNILIGYITGACLNFVVAFQVLYYGDAKTDKSKKEKKSE